jgi:hypothetical protein
MAASSTPATPPHPPRLAHPARSRRGIARRWNRLPGGGGVGGGGDDDDDGGGGGGGGSYDDVMMEKEHGGGQGVVHP